MNRIICAAAVLVLLTVGTKVRAGGLYGSEFATPSMGTAGAGVAARADDASTAFHNPAGMTRLQDHQAMLGLGFLSANIRFDPGPAG
jgi:long-chain fatty acid transport protein